MRKTFGITLDKGASGSPRSRAIYRMFARLVDQTRSQDRAIPAVESESNHGWLLASGETLETPGPKQIPRSTSAVMPAIPGCPIFYCLRVGVQSNLTSLITRTAHAGIRSDSSPAPTTNSPPTKTSSTISTARRRQRSHAMFTAGKSTEGRTYVLAAFRRRRISAASPSRDRAAAGTSRVERGGSEALAREAISSIDGGLRTASPARSARRNSPTTFSAKLTNGNETDPTT